MPFTPFHLGPSSWIGLILFKFLVFPTFLLTSVIVDIEPFAVMFLDLRYTLHGFFHSFASGSTIAMLTAIAMYYLRNVVRKFTTIFRLAQDSSFKKILWTSFIGVYFHILLDAPLYIDIQPFYPTASNPLLGLFSSNQIYFFCSISFLVAIALYFVRLIVTRKKP